MFRSVRAAAPRSLAAISALDQPAELPYLGAHVLLPSVSAHACLPSERGRGSSADPCVFSWGAHGVFGHSVGAAFLPITWGGWL